MKASLLDHLEPFVLHPTKYGEWKARPHPVYGTYAAAYDQLAAYVSTMSDPFRCSRMKMGWPCIRSSDWDDETSRWIVDQFLASWRSGEGERILEGVLRAQDRILVPVDANRLTNLVIYTLLHKVLYDGYLSGFTVETKAAASPVGPPNVHGPSPKGTRKGS